MTKRPAVPPENKSTKGVGSDPKPHEKKRDEKHDDVPENLEQQGRQGNIKQNTRNQGGRQGHG